MRVYAIGDVHGQLRMLRHCHALIAADRLATRDLNAPVVHLGDHCDRGPDTPGVIDFLLDGIRREPWVCLKGNHDRMMWLYLQDPPRADPVLRPDYTWLHPNLGGLETLAAYGVRTELSPGERHQHARRLIPEAHIAFLNALEPVFETEHLFFAHAGIRPGVPLADQTEDDLIWIRRPFHDDARDHGKLVVHGHTPVEHPTHAGNRVNLDTGAGYNRPMTAAVFEDADCFILTPEGRVPLAAP